MGSRGWVSAEVGPEEWKRLIVFDDGWVEVPGFARGLSDTRGQFRRLGLALAVVLASYVLGQVLDRIDGVPDLIPFLVVMVGLAALIYAVVLSYRFRRTDRTQARADWKQARRDRDAGRRLRRAPGAPLFRRARSARQFSEWVTGETYVDSARILDVRVGEEPPMHVVVVRLDSGEERTFRSPDAHLPLLLTRFGPGQG